MAENQCTFGLPEASAGTPCGAIHETGNFRAPLWSTASTCASVSFTAGGAGASGPAASLPAAQRPRRPHARTHTGQARSAVDSVTPRTGCLARYSITPRRCWRVRLGGCAADVRAISAQPHSAWLSEDDLRWILKEGIDLDRTAVSPPAPPHCATQPPSLARYDAACTARRSKRVSTFSVQSSSQACAGAGRRAVGHVGICSRCVMVLTLCCATVILYCSRHEAACTQCRVAVWEATSAAAQPVTVAAQPRSACAASASPA